MQDAPNSLPETSHVGRLNPWLGTAFVLGAAGVLLTYAFVAVVHANDRFRLDLVSGIMMGLSDDLNHGMLYPDIQSGERFGGVRYMPLQIFLHAGLAHLTGEYLFAGKLLTYTLTVALCL